MSKKLNYIIISISIFVCICLVSFLSSSQATGYNGVTQNNNNVITSTNSNSKNIRISSKPVKDVVLISEKELEDEVFVGDSLELHLFSGHVKEESNDFLRNGVIESGVHWLSSDSTIAAVSDIGVVTGVSIGTVEIKAIYKGEETSFKVKVKDKYNYNEEGIIKIASTIEVGKKENLKVLKYNSEKKELEAVQRIGVLYQGEGIDYDAITDDGIKWESDDTDIATVDDGVVTGVSEGIVKITATYTDEKGQSSADYYFKVVSPTPSIETPIEIMKPAENGIKTMDEGTAKNVIIIVLSIFLIELIAFIIVKYNKQRKIDIQNSTNVERR